MSDKPTAAELAEWREARTKATEGPWRTGDGLKESYYHGLEAIFADTVLGNTILAQMNAQLPNYDNDSEFIVTAANNWLRLLDYVAALEEELAMTPKMLGVRERAPMVIGEEAQDAK